MDDVMCEGIGMRSCDLIKARLEPVNQNLFLYDPGLNQGFSEYGPCVVNRIASIPREIFPEFFFVRFRHISQPFP